MASDLGSIGDAFVRIRASMDDWEREMQGVTEKASASLSSVGQKLSRAGQSMSLAVTLPIAGIGGLFLKTASDVEEMQSKFEAVFRESSADVAEWASSHASATSRSRYALQGYLAQLQDTFVPMGVARDEAAELAKQVTALGVDLGSFNNVAEPEVINALTSALVGNHESVRRFGVVINQATLEQELLNMGIQGGVKEATEQEKMLARLNLILSMTADAQGDAARTSDSFANQMRGLKASAEEVAVELGQILIPIAKDVIGWVKAGVDWFKSLDDQWKVAIVVVGGLAAAIGPVLVVLGAMASGLAVLLPILTGPVGIAAAIAAVVAAIGLFVTQGSDRFEGFRQAAAEAWESMRETALTVWASIQEQVSAVLAALGDVFTSASELFEAIWAEHGDEIMAAFKLAWDLISSLLSSTLTILGGLLEGGLKVLKGMMDVFRGLITGDWNVFTGGLKSIWEGIWTAIRGIFEGVAKLLKGQIEAWTGWLTGSWGRMTTGVQTDWNNLWEAIKRIVTGGAEWVANKVKGFTDSVTGFFGSMYDAVVGNSFVPDLIEGIRREFGRLPEVMELPALRSTKSVVDSFVDMFNRIVSAAKNWKQSLLSIVGGVVDGLLKGGGIIKSLTGSFGNLLFGGGTGSMGGFGIPGLNIPGMPGGGGGGIVDTLISKGIGKVLGGFFGGGSTVGALGGGMWGTGTLSMSGLTAPGGLLSWGAGSAGASGAGAGGAAGGGMLANMGAFLTNPWTIGIAGAIAAGFAAYKAFTNTPTEAGSKEIKRDFGVSGVSEKDLKHWLGLAGISDKAFEPIRKDILSSPLFFQSVLLPAAQARGEVDQLIKQFGKLEAFGKTYDFSAAAAAAAAGDFSKLNAQWSKLFEQSFALRQVIPNWREMLTVPVNEATDAMAGLSDGLTDIAEAASSSMGETVEAVEEVKRASVSLGREIRDQAQSFDEWIRSAEDWAASTTKAAATVHDEMLGMTSAGSQFDQFGSFKDWAKAQGYFDLGGLFGGGGGPPKLDVAEIVRAAQHFGQPLPPGLTPEVMMDKAAAVEFINNHIGGLFGGPGSTWMDSLVERATNQLPTEVHITIEAPITVNGATSDGLKATIRNEVVPELMTMLSLNSRSFRDNLVDVIERAQGRTA